MPGIFVTLMPAAVTPFGLEYGRRLSAFGRRRALDVMIHVVVRVVVDGSARTESDMFARQCQF